MAHGAGPRLLDVDAGAEELLARRGDDRHPGVAILTSAGEKFFCTGVDVKESRTRPMGHVWLPIARLMEQIHKPIICAVNGICCGGGLHFMCDTDIIIGSENAQFFDPHVNVGLISGWEPIGLSRRIPFELCHSA